MTRRVYIAGPISKGVLADNVNAATEAFVELAKAGAAPLCPHWSVYATRCQPCRTLDPAGRPVTGVACVGQAQPNELSHAEWVSVDTAWVAASDAVLRLPGPSVGADIEVAYAKSLGIPVFMNIDALIAWLQCDRPAAVDPEE